MRDWLPVLVGLLPALVMLGLNVAAAPAERAPAGDFAVLEIATRNALRGRQFLGAYSRFGWNHPGPAIFYWFAPFYRLFGSQLGGLVVASSAVTVLSLGLMIRTVQRASGRSAAWIVVAALAIALWLVGVDHVQSPWNSETLIVPLAAFGVVGSAAVVGRRWALPAAAVLASWVAQAHLGALPVVLTVCVLIAALTAWHHRAHLRTWALAAVLALAVTAAMWGPVIWEEATRSPGNVSQIREFYDQARDDPHAWGESASAVAIAVVGRQDAFDRDEPVAGADQLATSALITVVVAGAVLGWSRRRDHDGFFFQAVLCSFGLVGLVVAVVSLRNVDGPILRHLLSFATGLGLMLWTAAAVTIANAIGELQRRRAVRSDRPGTDGRPSRWRRLAPGLVLVPVAALISATVTTGPWNRNPAFPSTVAGVRHTLAVDNEQSATTAAAILRSPHVNPGNRVLIAWPGGWEIGAGVVNLLEKEDVDATVPAQLTYIFGEQRTADGSESARVEIIPNRSPYPAEWPPPPAARFRVEDGLAFRVYVVPLRF